MIGLALSGGGSRAIAFHLGCLRALNDLGILDKVTAISTISGGSVIGAYYAYTPEKSFAEFDQDIICLLREGFNKSIFKELIKPNNFVKSAYYSAKARVLKPVLNTNVYERHCKRSFSRTDIFKNVLEKKLFSGKTMESARRNNFDIVVGACELRTGTAFRFGSERSGGWRFGEVDNKTIELSFAVAASAAYPIFLPAMDRIWDFKKGDLQKKSRILLTDGGIYDNLGVQVLEPGRDSNYSVHAYPCDYMIVCNAGHGQETGDELPLTMYSRISKSFEITHRRVQNSTMQRLHQLKHSGLIKGFAMPYLGQLDNRLPIKPNPLVERKDVMGYPTNFSAMGDLWIEKLSNRGEQLTRALVSYYLSELL